MSYGDINQAGVGTATSVCDGGVVGFGHPMTFFGKTTLSLHPADALYIQEDSVSAPYKVANLGDPAGTIAEDHLTGITGSDRRPPDVHRHHLDGHLRRQVAHGQSATSRCPTATPR